MFGKRVGTLGGSGRPPFNPRRTFFSNNERGLWYDNADFATLYQDSAGTTPVTSVGQPVGRQLDKSGRGNHRFQATAVDRPILRQDELGNYYLEANGVNTWMQTNSIDFTGTDKMTVFAGVRKLSDPSSFSTIAELSTIPDATLSTFGLGANTSINAQDRKNYSFASRGAGATQLIGSGSSSFVAPISNVITCTADISGDSAKIRVDGLQKAEATGDQGAGNYGNYPLYFYRRAGTSTPFNGRDYGILIRGATSTDAQIHAMERWLAQRTGVVL